MAAQTPRTSLGEFNQGGLSTSRFSGANGSYYKMTGTDPHTYPGAIQAEFKLTKNSEDIVTELCKVAVSCSDGSQYWFSSDSGKIWECTSAGAWRLIHTTTPAAGEAKCLGAAEYNGYLYWATESRLHRIAVASANGNNWAGDAAEDWATFTVTDSEYHPMLVHYGQLILYIGDGNQLAQVEDTTFSAAALDIQTPLRISALGQIGTDLLMGTTVDNNARSAEILRWNGWSTSYTNSDVVPETGIYAFLIADNMVLVQAGLQGNVYYYDGTNLEAYMKIPGDWTPAKTAKVNPYSVGLHNGQILFGLSNVSGNPAEELVYRVARYDRNYPYILDGAYPISERDGTDFVLSGLEIGAILVVGTDFYVAWKNDTAYGVDKLDTTARLDNAYLETRVLFGDRWDYTNMSKIGISYYSLPASTDVNFYVDVNYAGYGSELTKVDDTARNVIVTHGEGREFTTLQIKLELETNNTDTPLIEGAMLELR